MLVADEAAAVDWLHCATMCSATSSVVGQQIETTRCSSTRGSTSSIGTAAHSKQ